MRSLPTRSGNALVIQPVKAISGRLLPSATSPAETLIELRKYFDELSKHQEFICTAWNQRYRIGLEISDPMNGRMRGAMSQVSAMLCMVDDCLSALENHQKPNQSAEPPAMRTCIEAERDDQ
ncbi:hypothetical protein ACN2AS_24255 [Serratia liquefaciens]|uniref:hypothetical protein n=1 Tax=Serratia liquefaciens TaxID=614 RepID=UPI003AF3C5A7